jgi:hypothetical protein
VGQVRHGHKARQWPFRYRETRELDKHLCRVAAISPQLELYNA